MPPLRPQVPRGGGHLKEETQGAGQGRGRQGVHARAPPRHLHQDQEHPRPGVQGAGSQDPEAGAQGAPPGFYKCGRRSNCALCQHSENATSYTCPVTGAVVNITQHITCQSAGVYLPPCRKDTAVCARLALTYVGICGEGESSSFTHRLAQHLGSATQPGQVDTVKPVGRHFHLSGHKAHGDLVMLPIELVSARDPFLLRARETFNINKFKTEKRRGVSDIEHGLNLDQGQ